MDRRYGSIKMWEPANDGKYLGMLIAVRTLGCDWKRKKIRGSPELVSAPLSLPPSHPSPRYLVLA